MVEPNGEQFSGQDRDAAHAEALRRIDEEADRQIRLGRESHVLDMVTIQSDGARRLRGPQRTFGEADIHAPETQATGQDEQEVTPQVQARRTAIDELLYNMTNPIDPGAPHPDYLKTLSPEDLDHLLEGVREEGKRVSARVREMDDEEYALFQAHTRAMRRIINDKDVDGFLRASRDRITDFRRKNTWMLGDYGLPEGWLPDQGVESSRQATPRGGNLSRRAVAAGVAIGVAGLATYALWPNSEGGEGGEQLKTPSGYELLVTNPEQVKDSFGDFRVFLDDELNKSATEKLFAQFDAIPPDQLANHFTAEAQIKDGVRTGTEYNFWFGDREKQGILPDLQVYRHIEDEFTTVNTATTEISATIDKEGNFVPSGTDVHMNRDERRGAVAKVITIFANGWDEDKSKPDSDSGSESKAKNNISVYPTTYGISENGGFGYWHRTSMKPDQDPRELPTAATDAGRAAQAMDVAGQARIAVASSVTEENLEQSKELLALAESITRQIKDAQTAMEAQSALAAQKADTAGHMAKLSFDPEDAEAAVAIANTITDPEARAAVNDDLALAALNEATISYDADSDEIANILAEGITDQASRDRIKADLAKAEEADTLLKEPGKTQEWAAVNDALDHERSDLSEKAGKSGGTLLSRVKNAFTTFYSNTVNGK